jgi:hypothetical protein
LVSGRWAKGFVRFAFVENEQRIRQATRNIGLFLKKDQAASGSPAVPVEAVVG